MNDPIKDNASTGVEFEEKFDLPVRTFVQKRLYDPITKWLLQKGYASNQAKAEKDVFFLSVVFTILSLTIIIGSLIILAHE